MRWIDLTWTSRWRGAVPALVGGAMVSMLAPPSPAIACESFHFPVMGDETARLMATPAMAKVYVDDGFRGSATVVLADPPTLLTADHLFGQTEGRITVTFGAAPGAEPTQADLIARDGALDVALLRLDDPAPEAVESLEIRLDALTEHGTFQLGGFARDRLRPLWRSGSATRIENDSFCRWHVAGVGLPGDSGGAVVDSAGLLAGVIRRNLEGGAFGGSAGAVTEVLSLHCAQDFILDTLAPDLGDDGATALALAIDEGALHRLKPPPGGAWIDNLTFAHALRYLGLHEAERLRTWHEAGRFQCPLFPAAFNRRAGYTIVMAAFEGVVASSLARAETVHHVANTLRETDAEGAIAAFRLADSAYEQAMESPPQTQARVLRARADVALALGQQTGAEADYTRAIEFANLAVEVAPTPEVKGGALAAMGSAHMGLGNFEDAITAYMAADMEGFSPVWMEQDFLDAQGRLGADIDLTPLSDFEERGTLDFHRLDDPSLRQP